jgi:hypothetical protein
MIPIQDNACDIHQNAVAKTVIGTTLIGLAIAGGRPQEMTPDGDAMHLYIRIIFYVFVRTSHYLSIQEWCQVVMKDGFPVGIQDSMR